MHPVVAHGLDGGQGWIVAYRGGELLIYGYDHVGIPHQNLFDRDIGETARRVAGDIAADQFDGLDIDRSAEASRESLWPSRIIDPRPRVRCNRINPTENRFERIVGVACELLGILRAADQFAERAVGLGDRIETAIHTR